MEVNKETLYQKYSGMETEELVELYLTSDLTNLALEVISSVFLERNIEISTLDSAYEELSKENSKFSGRYKKAVAEEENRKQREREGEFGESRAVYRRTLDETPFVTKVASFGLWALILFGLYWLFFT